MTPPPPPSSGIRSKLPRHMGPRLQRAIVDCEETCRSTASACMSYLHGQGKTSEVDACLNHVMDCSYVASAAARLLSRFDRHDVDLLVFQLEVCRRSASDCADACHRRAQAPGLEACARLSRACAKACGTLLTLLRAQPAIVLDEDVMGPDQSDSGNGASSLS